MHISSNYVWTQLCTRRTACMHACMCLGTRVPRHMSGRALTELHFAAVASVGARLQGLGVFRHFHGVHGVKLWKLLMLGNRQVTASVPCVGLIE